MMERGLLVIDASVAIKWYIPEPSSAAAAALLAGGDILLAPELLAAELGNVLWKKVRQGELTAGDADQIAAAFSSTPPLTLRPTLPILPAALEIALTYQRTVYDALYLALAVAEGGRLVTADEKLVQAANRTPLQPFVRLLGSFAGA